MFTNMEEINTSCCRICLREAGTARNIFTDKLSGQMLVTVLEDMFGLSINSIDWSEDSNPIPYKICEKCHCRLQIAVELKSVAVKSHDRIDEFEQNLLNQTMEEEHLIIKEESEEVYVEALDDEETDSVDTVQQEPHEVSAIKQLPKVKPSKRKILLSSTELIYPNRVIPCPHCDKRFSCRQSLCNHKRLYHGDVPKNFQCQYCSRFFSSGVMLSRHVQTHTQEEMFSCDQCGLSFTQESTLKRHMHRHKKDTAKGQYACAHCGKMYSYKNNLLFNHKCEKKIELSGRGRKLTPKKY